MLFKLGLVLLFFCVFLVGSFLFLFSFLLRFLLSLLLIIFFLHDDHQLLISIVYQELFLDRVTFLPRVLSNQLTLTLLDDWVEMDEVSSA